MSLDDKVKPVFICIAKFASIKMPSNRSWGQRLPSSTPGSRSHRCLCSPLSCPVICSKREHNKASVQQGGDQTVMGSPHPNGTPGMCVRSKGCIRLPGPPIHQLLVLPPPHPPPPSCHLLIYLMRNHNKCGE